MFQILRSLDQGRGLWRPEPTPLGQPWLLPPGCLQVLLNVLTLNRNLSDSLARGRLHPDLQTNLLQVDSEWRAKVPMGWAQGRVEKGASPKGAPSLTGTSSLPVKVRFLSTNSYQNSERSGNWNLPCCFLSVALQNAGLHSEPWFSHL